MNLKQDKSFKENLKIETTQILSKILQIIVILKIQVLQKTSSRLGPEKLKNDKI